MDPRALPRLVSDYSALELSTELYAADIISLLWRERAHEIEDPELFAFCEKLREYYRGATSALCRGLGISEEKARSQLFEDPGEPRLESLYFRHLLEAREHVVHFYSIFGNMLEPETTDDPWGRHSEFAPPKVRQARAEAASWYELERVRMLEGLVPIDRAICYMLKWDPERSVSYAVLRHECGFPDPGTYEFEW